MKRIFILLLLLIATTGFAQDSEYQIKDIPLNGKLITSLDPLQIGNNFQQLQNMRYNETAIAGVGGMTAVNANALTNTKVRSAFHFVKSQPVESHLIVQAYNTGLTESNLYQNTTAIKSVGDYSPTTLHTDSSGAGIGRFSYAPNGDMVYCNSVECLIWGGNETRLSKFITSTSATTLTITNARDYTDEVSNTLQTTEEVAQIGGGNDSNTKLLLHINEADGGTVFNDSSTTGHATTANGNVQADTAQKKFGLSAGLFDGNGDYVSIADNANWNFSTSKLTIETWVRFSALTGQSAIWSQATGTGYVALIQDHVVDKLFLQVMGAGTRVTIQSVSWNPSVDTWYHLALIRGWGGGANDWAFTVDGVAIGTFTASVTMPDIATTPYIGSMNKLVIEDYGNTGHAGTLVANATLTLADSKFGQGSLILDGTGDYLSIPDHDNWDVSVQTNATIDFFVKHADHVGTEVYASDYPDANNHWDFRHVHGSGLNFYIVDSGSIVLTLTGGEISDTNWHHVALCKVGNEYGIYLDGVQTAYVNDASSIDLTGASLVLGTDNSNNDYNGNYAEFRVTHNNVFTAAPNVGLSNTITVPTTRATSDSNTKLLLPFDTKDLNGWLDEFMVSSSARWSAAFTPKSSEYVSSADYWLVAATRPLQGVKFYVADSNATSATIAVQEWNGSSWTTITSTDNTSGLSATGTITWSSTVSTSKQKYLNGLLAYWYQFNISAGEATIYYATADAPFQPIVDIWDGETKTNLSMQKYDGTSYNDNTQNTFDENYSSADTATYVDLSALGTSSYIVVGFSEQQLGLDFVVVSGANNTTPTTATVYYSNGVEWITTSNMQDDTSQGVATLGKSGVISWEPPTLTEEFRQEISRKIPLYYYKVSFSAALSATVKIDFIGGIPAPKDIAGYKFPLFAQNRLWLASNQSGKKNTVLVSAAETSQVFNGSDSMEIEIGDDTEITAGTSLYSQFGSSLYDVVVLTKPNSTWIITGTDSENWTKYNASSTIGCVAPLTMQTAHVELASVPGLNRSVAIWQGADGIYLFDGRSVEPIHNDIKNLFDKRRTGSINPSKISSSVGFIDEYNMEYHWLFASGTSTTLNKEYVYDIQYKKWYEINRGTGKALQYGLVVTDTDYNKYNYGMIDTGYTERLENGTTFDGTAIEHIFWLGDIPLNQSPFYLTELRNFKLGMIAKTNTTSAITATHYGDTKATGTSLTMTPTNAGYRTVDIVKGGGLGPYLFHSTKYSISTSNETKGFEPIYVSYLYKLIRIDRD